MATVELRCGGNLYGLLTDGRWLEVKCKRRSCGYVKGTVVLHTIDTATGKVTKTQRYAEPRNSRKEQGNAPDYTPASVRSS